MFGFSTETLLGAALILMGSAKIVHAIVISVRGVGYWWAGHSLELEADRESDPVGFQTVVGGNGFQGILMLALGVLLLAGML